MHPSHLCRTLVILLGLFCIASLPAEPAHQAGATQDQDPLAWPKPTAENRPWTRWWWLGSAVDKENLTLQLEQFKAAGIGGVEICPIYGAKGYEDRYIDFLSPKWMDMLAHTITEAKRLGLGVDMTTGTGWPFGGPEVTTEDAIGKVVLKSYDVAGGASLKADLPKGQLECLIAVSDAGERVDLTAKVTGGKIDWTAPQGQWKVYALVLAPSGMIVKRPAPGGEGLVIDPYSLHALDKYLTRFDKALATLKAPMPRSQFHDSFEYANATWTPNFLQEFEKRRGYDLRTQLPALFGTGTGDVPARVKYDYRLTIAELHEAWIKRWTDWCHAHGSLSRDQAHGATGNLIDLYAAADIPETESYKKIDDRLLPMQKFASSAAHLSGRPLASCESFTWLKEHFQASLADLKPAVDFYFLAGINHIFFHGIPYSPKDAPWPGWQFYASVNFGPSGGIWRDLPEFNAYVTRCQSILQVGKPANDVLLYFPIHDLWQGEGSGKGGGKGGGANITAMQFTTPGTWMYGTPFHNAAMQLWKQGVGYDQVSDEFLARATVQSNGRILLGGNSYFTVVVPKCKYMPEKTLKKLLDLAEDGGRITFLEALPADVPGLGDLDKRRAALKRMLDSIPTLEAIAPVEGFEPGYKHAIMGRGSVIVRDSMDRVRPFFADNIGFLRRSDAEGDYCFIVNRGNKPFDNWVPFYSEVVSAVLLDPLFKDRIGLAKVWQAKKTRTAFTPDSKVYLQLQPGEACVLRTYKYKKVEGRPWHYQETDGQPWPLAGTWKVRFIEGGPALPAAFETTTLGSWTAQADAEAKRFAGTAVYTLEFDRPAGDAKDWRLDLGRVADSARVRLNGKALGTLWCPPFQLLLGDALRPGKNTLEVEVTNVAANRIADMDRRGVKWKIFRDANVLSVNGGNFDASKWPVREAGLIGPVTLVPLREIAFDTPKQEATEKRLPTLCIIGDSTVRNNTKGQLGWGDPIAGLFDKTKITVANRALGGRSSRTFISEGLWDKVLAGMRPGDFVLMQFGHNDGGPLDKMPARGSLRGSGDETKEIVNAKSGKQEVVHTYGWYMRKYVADAKAKGATPIVLSQIPRNMWKDGKVVRASGDYGKWAAEAAKAEGAAFVDLNEIVAKHYEKLGPDKVNGLFEGDHTHTNAAGAQINAAAVVEGLRELKDCPLSNYLGQ